MRLPPEVTIVEVGPRDGLQNEAEVVPTEVKVELIERLAAAGLRVVEATSFVSPRWVPQLADAEEVLARLHRRPGVRYPVLVPNFKGLERALAAGATEIAVFTAASEAFCQRNINCSIAESLDRYRPVVARAKERGLWVRGYVSTVLGCPYQGPVPTSDVVRVTQALFELGCDEVSLGDTIGVGTVAEVQRLIAAVAAACPLDRIAVHFHDTYGQGLANTLAALDAGVRTADTSAGGLGGCPFAPGARGNLATEDLVYALERSGVRTGVDLDAVVATSAWFAERMGRPVASRAAEALLSRR